MSNLLEIQKRGMLTKRVKSKSLELLGYEMTTKELRLLPFIQYTLVNSQRLKPELINENDKAVLSKYVRKGYVIDGVTEKGRPMMSEGVVLKVTKEFWDIMLEIIWLSYVDLSEA